MKKTTFFLFLLLLLSGMLAFSSCTNDIKNRTDVNMEHGTNIQSWVGHSFDKILVNVGMPENAKSAYTVYAAKGETEGCSVGILSKHDEAGLTIQVNPVGELGISPAVYHVRESMTIRGNTYTDPAVPQDPEVPFTLEANKTAAFLVEFTVTEYAAAGEHLYEVCIFDKDSNLLALHEITLHVWDFEMPKEKTFATAMGYDRVPLNQYYDILLEHNVCGARVPYGDFSLEISQEIMSSPKVPAFRFMWEYVHGSDEELVRIYNLLKQNPEWIEKVYFYAIDEPRTIEHLDTLKERCEWLRSLCPDIRIVSPFYSNVQYNEELDQLAFMAEYIDLHCPKLSMWEDNTFYTEAQQARYGSFADRIKELQERGDGLWAYICGGDEKDPYFNIALDDKGLESRIIFWQMYQRDIEGFLYWHSCYWNRLPDQNPWLSLDTFNQNDAYGDGILLYPGEKIGMSGLIPSIRLKIIRDGIDDVELMYLAETVLGEERTKEMAFSVSKTLTTTEVDSDGFAEVRIQLGNAIEEAMKKK